MASVAVDGILSSFILDQVTMNDIVEPFYDDRN